MTLVRNMAALPMRPIPISLIQVLVLLAMTAEAPAQSIEQEVRLSPDAAQESLKRLIDDEDTNGDRRITVADKGDKRFELRGPDGQVWLIEDTYHLANLLQELALAARTDRPSIIRGERIYERPAARVSRMIREVYWDRLTRRLDADGLAKALSDPKLQSGDQARLYVPHDDRRALKFYRQLVEQRSDLEAHVVRLPKAITPQYVSSIRDQPGLLSLAMRKTADGHWAPRPYVVPGGRFNELYGWDSYFIVLGLLADGRVELARGMVDHFIYEIEHYGKILNANRTYYLTRSQPPFLTSMLRAVHRHLPAREQKQWLRRGLVAAIVEYESVWTSGAHLTETGLSRYYGQGKGIPPETEPSHYEDVLTQYAQRHDLPLTEFVEKYQQGDLQVPSLDEYFKHDRAMRESGHDTTWRLVGRAAHLNTVALNSLLYAYERDIARLLKRHFAGQLKTPDGTIHTARQWKQRAEKRRRLVNRWLWNDDRGVYFDYDFVASRQWDYVSATTFYPLWAGLASERQAERVLASALPLLKAKGGILAAAPLSAQPTGAKARQRQWDYPFGWAPHQTIAWDGLRRYGFRNIERRLIYRWLHTVVTNAARHNGAVVEKYDVVERTLLTGAEYGNVGRQFEYVPDGGFGWTNASVQVGLKRLPGSKRRLLNHRIPPEWIE